LGSHQLDLKQGFLLGIVVTNIPSAPELVLDFGIFSLDGTQLLFLLGGLAIATGIFTYSHKVMNTVGNGKSGSSYRSPVPNRIVGITEKHSAINLNPDIIPEFVVLVFTLKYQNSVASFRLQRIPVNFYAVLIVPYAIISLTGKHTRE